MQTSSASIRVINFDTALNQFTDLWSPKIIGEMNESKIQLVKVKGEFVWHHHEKEDEMFYVIHGELIIHFRDRDIVLHPGEMAVVPSQIEHMTEAKQETHILLIEPKGTLNTGNVKDEKSTQGSYL